MKQYLVIENENSKYKKDVPYITKKEFKKKENSNVVGTTVLKKYTENTNSDKYGILSYDEKQYRYKEKYFGWKKGYISVDNNEFILLKSRIPFFLIFLFLIFLFLLLFFINPKDNNEPIKDIFSPIIEEQMPDPPKEEIKEPKQEEEVKPSKPVIQTPKVEKYLIKYDANGGYGKVDSITCIKGQKCLVSENSYSKKGHTFTGWSLSKDGEVLYDNEDIFDENNLNSNNTIILYAIWEVNEYKIMFTDYDDAILSEQTLPFDSIIENIPTPTREGYNFNEWDSEVKKVTDDITYKAVYKINDYKLSFELNGGSLDNKVETYNVETESFEIEEPIKDGHTFMGWSVSNDDILTKNYKIEKGSIGDISLIAHYKPNFYFINYDTTGSENNYEPKEVEFLSNYGDLIIPERKGYTFVEWKDKEGNVVTKDNILNMASDVNIFAEWKLNDYKLSYELNGGKLDNLIETYNIESETFTIEEPIKEGYIFVGWKVNNSNDLIKKYTIEKGTIGDINLVACYNPISYIVKYDANGGTGTMENSKYIYDETGTLTKNMFTYEGKNFLGWSLKSDGKVIYKDREEILNLTNVLNSEVTLYAQWETQTFTVKFYDMFNILLSEQVVEYGNKPTIPKTALWEGHTFTGWNPEISAIKNDVSYTASYTKNTYTIICNFNRGIENDTEEIKYYVDTETFSLEEPTREGYTFIGWTGSNGIRKTLDITIQKGSTGNRSYTANWKANSYDISLNPNGGSVLINTVSVPFDSEYGILPTPIRTGYKFEGWYYNDALINEDTVLKVNSNHELIAKWKVIDYTMDYNLNGGTAILPSKYNIESETFTLDMPVKTGYIFIGWTGSNGNVPQTNITIEKGSIGNRNYTANWKAEDYKITYNLNGGSSASLISTYNIETNTFTLPQPTKTGYTFVGWTGTGLNSATKSVSINKGSTGNRDYTANWQANNYTITYNLNGGSASSLIKSYNIETNTFTLPQPTKTGYTFVGWTGTGLNSTTKSVSINKGSIGNRSYTANWQATTYSISYNLNGGTASVPTSYNIENSITLPQPTKTGYIFKGWTGSNGNTPQVNVTISQGNYGNKTYTANWEKYSTVSYNGIYLVSTRNNVTWEYNLDGHYQVGDTNVHSGNWKVTVDEYCVYLTGTTYPYNPYTYQFYVYQANNTSQLLATGNASVLGNYLSNAKATICW